MLEKSPKKKLISNNSPWNISLQADLIDREFKGEFNAITKKHKDNLDRNEDLQMGPVKGKRKIDLQIFPQNKLTERT